MARWFFALATLLYLLGEVRCQAPEEQKPTRITIHPARAPVPALRYRLLPELRNRTSGNAALDYYRSFAEELSSESRKQRDKALMAWEDGAQMPPKELQAFANFAWLRQVDVGARRTYCDWDMLERLRKDGVSMLLPDVQIMRERIRLLAARARFELAEGKIDQAIQTFQTGLQLSQHISEGPTLIQFLVGLATGSVMLEQLEQVFAHPQGPNLYWALTDLPRPLMSTRTSMQGERIILDSLAPGLREMLYNSKSKPVSVQAANDLADRIMDGLRMVDGVASSDRILNRLGLAVMAARAYPESKKQLLALGHSERAVKEMPMILTYLLYEIYNFDRIFDSFAKWMCLPYREASHRMQEAERRLKQEKVSFHSGSSTGNLLGLLLVPAVLRVKQAEYRLERKIAFLRTLEALRLHAGDNDGKLPARLEDIKEVAIPIDPLTDRAFQYQLDGQLGRLTAPAPPGWLGDARGVIWVYEITVKK